MAEKFLVWIEIERADEDNDEYENLDAPGASVAKFDTYEEAYRFAVQLTEFAYQMFDG